MISESGKSLMPPRGLRQGLRRCHFGGIGVIALATAVHQARKIAQLACKSLSPETELAAGSQAGQDKQVSLGVFPQKLGMA